MNYMDKTLKLVEQIADGEFKAAKAWVDSEIQAPSWEELDKLAFDKALEEVHALEEAAGGNA